MELILIKEDTSVGGTGCASLPSFVHATGMGFSSAGGVSICTHMVTLNPRQHSSVLAISSVEAGGPRPAARPRQLSESDITELRSEHYQAERGLSVGAENAGACQQIDRGARSWVVKMQIQSNYCGSDLGRKITVHKICMLDYGRLLGRREPFGPDSELFISFYANVGENESRVTFSHWAGRGETTFEDGKSRRPPQSPLIVWANRMRRLRILMLVTGKTLPLDPHHRSVTSRNKIARSRFDESHTSGTPATPSERPFINTLQLPSPAGIRDAKIRSRECIAAPRTCHAYFQYT
ncbi:hypothetical protein BDY19DRAFT_1047145, partial [Irpex rosettiformis]